MAQSPLDPLADPRPRLTRRPRLTSNVVQFRPRRRVTAWLASAAAAAVLLVGGLAWSPWDNGSDGRGNVSATEQVLEAKDAQRYEKVIGGAKATIVRSASLGKAVIIADHMPAAPDGKDFQLWFDQPNRGMVSAGVMPHGSADTVTVLLEGDAATATGAGITHGAGRWLDRTDDRTARAVRLLLTCPTCRPGSRPATSSSTASVPA